MLPRLSQGETMSRETYPSHRWVVREAASRGLLMIVVAKRPTGAAQSQSVTIEPQCVSIISDGGLDPLKVAVLGSQERWSTGTRPRTNPARLRAAPARAAHPRSCQFRCQ